MAGCRFGTLWAEFWVEGVAGVAGVGDVLGVEGGREKEGFGSGRKLRDQIVKVSQSQWWGRKFLIECLV